MILVKCDRCEEIKEGSPEYRKLEIVTRVSINSIQPCDTALPLRN